MVKVQGYCGSCGHACGHTVSQNKYTLSMNIIKVLDFVARSCQKKGYFETKEIYSQDFKGSNTAFLTQLKYFGFIQKYNKIGFQRDGTKSHWEVTPLGFRFLKGFCHAPAYVIVQDQKVIQLGPLVPLIQLKWKKHQDILDDLRSYWGGQ